MVKGNGNKIKTSTIEEAVALIKNAGYHSGIEIISIDMADGRVLAETITSRVDIPGFDRSIKDGFVCISDDLIYASQENPVMLRIMGTIPMGRTNRPVLSSGQVYAVSTGSLLPGNGDCVVMNEDVTIEDGFIKVTTPVKTGINIVRRGDDIKDGEDLFPVGWTIKPQDIGFLAAIGQSQISVWNRPHVGIISTGTELVSANMEPADGEVREVNSYLISTFLRRQGAVPMIYGIIRDDKLLLEKTLLRASHDCDMVVLSGGSSHGERDITRKVIEDLGDKDRPGIVLGPGKPTHLRFVNGTPVIGLPGHPVSSFLILTLVFSNLIQGLKGSPCQPKVKQLVTMGEDLIINPNKEHIHLAKIQDGVATTVNIIPGLLGNLLQSDGILKIESGTTKISKGDQVEVIIW